MPSAAPKLPLTPVERSNLRSSKIKLRDIAEMDLTSLSECLQSSSERATYICGLAQLQSIPSIGPKVAERVVRMGYTSLKALAQVDGADLYNRMEQWLGYWEDPCLEDSLRCIVHHAKHPESELNWFDFTEERKRYREQYGYPSSRPTTAWYEKKND